MRYLLGLATVLFLAPASLSAQERSQLAHIAARQVVAIYARGGLNQVQTNSADCYRYITDKFLCIYQDIAAQQIDRAVVDPIQMPRDPYFDDPQLFQRIGPIFINAGMNLDDANAFLRRSHAQISAALAHETQQP